MGDRSCLVGLLCVALFGSAPATLAAELSADLFNDIRTQARDCFSTLYKNRRELQDQLLEDDLEVLIIHETPKSLMKAPGFFDKLKVSSSEYWSIATLSQLRDPLLLQQLEHLYVSGNVRSVNFHCPLEIRASKMPPPETPGPPGHTHWGMKKLGVIGIEQRRLRIRPVQVAILDDGYHNGTPIGHTISATCARDYAEGDHNTCPGYEQVSRACPYQRQTCVGFPGSKKLHGTSMATTIAGGCKHGTQFGVAPGIAVLHIYRTRDAADPVLAMVDALERAIQTADVIAIAYEVDDRGQKESPLARVLEAALERDRIVVISAGNNEYLPQYLARLAKPGSRLSNLIVVGAVEETDKIVTGTYRPDVSQVTGDTDQWYSVPNTIVDVWMPTENIPHFKPRDDAWQLSWNFADTSGATAFAAGAAAIMLSMSSFNKVINHFNDRGSFQCKRQRDNRATYCSVFQFPAHIKNRLVRSKCRCSLWRLFRRKCSCPETSCRA